MKRFLILCAATAIVAAPAAFAQPGSPGERGGVQSGADGTMPGTTGAPGANAPGGTGTAGSGPTYPPLAGLTPEEQAGIEAEQQIIEQAEEGEMPEGPDLEAVE